MFKACSLCPRNCMVDRSKSVGFCGINDKIVISLASLHQWEEPCISLNNGSGTIFFSHCNLKCIYCQNYRISTLGSGKEISVEEFCDICLELQNKKAHNINLVTPTMYVPLIIEGINLAKSKGLIIPIIYNTSSYENVETIKMLEGTIDVYLADFKYYDNDYAIKYSSAPNYIEVAKDAINEMYKQVGKNIFNSDGLMTRGLMIRHLVLPELYEDAKLIIKYIYDTYRDNVFISIMNQYTPISVNNIFPSLNKKIKDSDYNDIINYACDLGIEKAFIQEEGTCSLSFIPNFNNDGI